MTGWQVFLLVILALALLLWAPVCLRVKYNNGQTEAVVRYLLFRTNLLPAGSGASQAPKKEKQKKKTAGKAEKAARQAQEEEKPSPVKQALSYADLLPGVLKSLNRAGRFLLRHTAVRPLVLRMVIAEGDAAETGIAYGKANAAVYTAYGLLSQYLKLRRVDIGIRPDFLAQEGSVEAELGFRLSPGAALAAGILLLGGTVWAFLNRSKSSGTQKESAKTAAAAASR